MLIAGIFGSVLFLAMIFGDWYQFTSLQSWASRYGFGIARRQDRLTVTRSSTVSTYFDKQGVLQLPMELRGFS